MSGFPGLGGQAAEEREKEDRKEEAVAAVAEEEQEEDEDEDEDDGEEDEDLEYYYYNFNEEVDEEGREGQLNNNEDDPEFFALECLSPQEAETFLLNSIQALATAAVQQLNQRVH